MTSTARVRLPAQDPFSGLSAHYGMLLGVADLDTVVGHPWAKQRLHNSWLHGAAVVWGFGVTVDDGEAKVRAGLATDPVGHELYLPTTYCVDLAAWRAQQDAVLGQDRAQPFDAHVVARFRACLSREVPALAATCEDGRAGTAYSRITETTELCLLPGPSAPEPEPADFPRVRRFLHDAPPPAAAEPPPNPVRPGTDPTADVAAAWATVRAAAAADRAAVHLTQLRLLAVYDGIERRPAPNSLYPGPEPDSDDSDADTGTVLLADLVQIRVTDDPSAATVERIDYTGRRQHVPGVDLPELIPPQPDGGQP